MTTRPERKTKTVRRPRGERPPRTLEQTIRNDWTKAARLIPGAEWRRRVNRIKDEEVRIQTACIIWWDHFGQQQASERWLELDDIVKSWTYEQKAGEAEVKAALIECGYPPTVAEARVKAADDYSMSEDAKRIGGQPCRGIIGGETVGGHR